MSESYGAQHIEFDARSLLRLHVKIRRLSVKYFSSLDVKFLPFRYLLLKPVKTFTNLSHNHIEKMSHQICLFLPHFRQIPRHATQSPYF